jgi:uncharacterized protein YndB with AHSA1/START domain
MPGVVIPFPRAWIALYRRLWNDSLNRLNDHLKLMTEGDHQMNTHKIESPVGEPIMILTRTFDAPRALVWKAMSEPQHIIGWFGPHGHKNRVLEFDCRTGGKWKFESTLPDGQVIVFFGDYLEVDPPRRTVQTFSFDGLPPGVHSVEEMTLTEAGGKTLYRTVSTFPDVASRDAMLASGMEVGVREGFERLDAMLEDWKAHA